MNNINSKRFYSLDAFRGMLAVFIIIFHIRIINSITELSFFRNSYAFVNFFFVLSGFVIMHSYGNREMSFNIFFLSRVKRLYPLHTIMFLVFLFFEVGRYIASIYLNFNFNTPPFTGVTSISQILPNLLLLQSWIPSAEHLSFNYPSWSISVEFYIYLAFFMLSKFQHKFIYFSLSFFIAALLVLNNKIIATSEATQGIFCFFAGVISYYIYSNSKNIKISILLATLLEIFICTTLIISVSMEFLHKDKIIILFFMLTVLIFSFEAGGISWILKRKLFQYLGRISYSIYMTHAATIFVVTFFMIFLSKKLNIDITDSINGIRFFYLGSSLISNLTLGLTILLSLIIAAISHQLIERNINKIVRWIYVKKS